MKLIAKKHVFQEQTPAMAPKPICTSYRPAPEPQPVDQAERLRLMVRAQRKTASVLAVSSGKGGVGKTNVAANLAICLAAAGKDVILIDADLGLANLDVILPVHGSATLAHVIAQQRRLEEVIRQGPAGVRLICGASGLAQMADLSEFQRQRLIEEMSVLEHEADVIVIDTGAGISRNVLAFCQGADHTLVVTTPEPPSITDAYALIKTVTQDNPGTRLSLLVNMVDSRAQGKMIYQRIAEVTQRFLGGALYNAGYVFRDEHLPQAVQERQPVVLAYPRCPASQCLVALAQKIGRARRDDAQAPGFFRKVANWFF